jgi:hypothetical protein
VPLPDARDRFWDEQGSADRELDLDRGDRREARDEAQEAREDARELRRDARQSARDTRLELRQESLRD